MFMVLALIAGLAAAWLTSRELARRNAIAQTPMRLVAVAAVDIPRATTLRADLIDYVAWPTTALPAGVTLKSNSQDLQGRVVAHDLGKGEPLLEAHLAPKGKGLGMASVLPEGMRAMTVMVNDVIGVAGFIHPDDFVDVLVTMSASSSGALQDIRAKIILQDVKVIAVGQEMVTQDAKPVKVPVVTLLVDAPQSERLALASAQGKIQLTLRSRADEKQEVTTGVSPPELFGREITEKKTEAPKARVATKPAAKPQPEVVEVLHGDHLEERQIRSSEGK